MLQDNGYNVFKKMVTVFFSPVHCVSGCVVVLYLVARVCAGGPRRTDETCSRCGR